MPPAPIPPSGSQPPEKVQGLADTAVDGAAPARRQAEEQTQHSEGGLMQISGLATASEIVAVIAHELNQPLTAVANYAHACDRLLGLPDPDIEEIRNALKQIAAQAVRAGDIILRLRSMTCDEAAKRAPMLLAKQE
jgi:two-component system sensor kinase FixL